MLHQRGPGASPDDMNSGAFIRADEIARRQRGKYWRLVTAAAGQRRQRSACFDAATTRNPPMNTSDAVQQLLDLEAIKTLKHRYIRCMTQSRWDELETLLAPDIDASYSDGKYVFSRSREPDGLPAPPGSRRRPPAQLLARHHAGNHACTRRTAPAASGPCTTSTCARTSSSNWRCSPTTATSTARSGRRWLIARTGYERVMEQSLDRRDAARPAIAGRLSACE